MAVRPTEMKLILNRNNRVYMLSKHKVEIARFAVNDLLAEDWCIVPIPDNALVATPESD